MIHMQDNKETPVDVTRYIPGVHCPECRGIGDTDETRTVMRRDSHDVLYTHRQGSGCPRCCGTGKAVQ